MTFHVENIEACLKSVTRKVTHCQDIEFGKFAIWLVAFGANNNDKIKGKNYLSWANTRCISGAKDYLLIK